MASLEINQTFLYTSQSYYTLTKFLSTLLFTILQMATKNCSDGTSHHSSIALLQERFRQLQRAKEMREEKELLRLLSESERSNPTTTKRYEAAAAAGFSFHSESLLPHSHSHRPPSHHQSSIYHLQPNLQSKHGGNLQTSTDHTTSIIGNITSTSAAINNNRSYNLDGSDVDTSLHL
ncbi:hypothetical protein CsatA_004346 [Cannabis sativa]